MRRRGVFSQTGLDDGSHGNVWRSSFRGDGVFRPPGLPVAE
jgi:hypothetical protein